MQPQHLFIPFVLLSYAAAAPFLLTPSTQSMNSLGDSFSRGFRSFANRGANMMDDSLICPEYLAATNGGSGSDNAFFAQNGGRIRQNRLDFKLSCLAQQRGKESGEAVMNMGSKAKDASSEYSNGLENKAYGQQGGGDGYGQQQSGEVGYDQQP
ncbi:hypothetical protein BGZ91_002953 [Linnemannia elongata]|nr:hypothetical protein BGZ91_002953 [Linnemannia elongata]KAG0048652.1 hypothetical protein BGZ90_007570 [Linnemannia elongata]